jgi:hypothetical protein
VAGQDNKHLDFRLSVLKTAEAGKTSVVLSTVCDVHNTFGKFICSLSFPFINGASKRSWQTQS